MAASFRPQVSGKFLSRGGRKLPVHGVTYGTFRPDERGDAYPPPPTVARDFEEMVASGVNAVRTYTTPPRWLLDLAQEHGLLVMAGIAWEQHVAFLDDRGRPREIERRVRAAVRACAGHPAILAYSVGSEIPAPIVRWHGRARVQRFLRRLVVAAKEEDPGALVTYVNYPSTEYLELDCVDFLCFNVYLEQEERLRAYLARLHNLAGDRPLVLAELGLDSRSNGVDVQAASLEWQLRAAFAEGCAGAFVYAWTDEWYITHLGEDGMGHGGTEILDWDFGLTDRARRPKPALQAVRRAFAEPALDQDGTPWPRISVVVCSYNGAATIGECCAALCALDYPDYEVLVVDDGSSDATAEIAAGHGLRVVSTENRGLSSARNTGWREATGEIVAYTDDDAAPDRDWLRHLARSFVDGGHAGVGGPNIIPPGSHETARCVSSAPGNPTHVLISDREAEHIPGCNAAFRRDALEAVGGFDHRFRVAGDDVDICWRIREQGWTLGFSSAAMVFHRPRESLVAYWRQQRGYGRAEAQLERKWPRRYNAAGYTTWRGRVYGGLSVPFTRRARVYHGRWGTAPFQPLYQGRADTLGALPATPEWYLLTIVLLVWAGVALAAGLPWPVLLPPAATAGMSVALACLTARHAHRGRPEVRRRERALVALLCALQPAARLHGRLEEGLTPWRRNGRAPAVAPWPRTARVWSEQGRSCEQRLADLEEHLSAIDATATAGGDCDRWDHEVPGGCLCSARLRTAVEEHGAGRQLVRFRIYPRIHAGALVAIATLALLAAVVVAADAPGATAVVLVTMAVALVARAAVEASRATGQLVRAVAQAARREGAAVDESATVGEGVMSDAEATAALEGEA